MALLSRISLFILCALVALVSAASNPISSPTTGDTLKTGQPFLVQWKPSNNHTISLFLKQGPPSNLQSVLTIITNLPNTGIVRWTPPSRIYTGKDYTITIQDDITGDVNYSNQFAIDGLSPVSSTTSTSSSSSSSLSPSTTSETSFSSSTSSSTMALTTASSDMSLSSPLMRTANFNTSSVSRPRVINNLAFLPPIDYSVFVMDKL
ncbi:Ser-Thr-rich glycosyl-phosphatidyl-inositol-anchored membrane family-domain-containing protein [Lipomyces chichibuensis]|uniref:Ser-Thr-rich glycosyl-phosphatidyl-inositol-anchored membrane family-domain-containing protein n=1 Tax=Lipomyces chichibuensis TaxID=1546026 RepID=UPI003342E7D8